MTNESELQPLLSRPDLPAIAETINAKLSAERDARGRFRHELTPSMKAEFIGGEVIMHSPAKAKHLRVTQKLVGLLSAHVQRHRIGEVFAEKALICLSRNDYEPDIVFFGRDKSNLFTDNQTEFPAPDFIVEVLSDSTESRDRGVKFTDYADHQVSEYWIVDCDEQSVEQYVLRKGESKYHLAQKLTNGSITSVVVTDFDIPVRAVFDDKENAEAMRRILT